ncbi:MAG: UDP-N-acetylmuramoyl-L-alanine--D-glutamate ligase [Bacteroidota bacterium]
MNQRVVILGAGESGTGAAILAKAKGYDVFVSDMAAIKPVYQEALNTHGIAFEQGMHTDAQIFPCDLLIKSPGIPDKAPVVKAAHGKGIPVLDEIEFAFRFLKGKVIAISGTNGKTTTTLLTHHLLATAGFRVALAGNVGKSLAVQVAEGDHDWYVIEISSFQLDGTETFRPDIAILTNITPDHLDRYEYRMENYIRSKFRITGNMRAEDHFIFYGEDPVLKAEVAQRSFVPSVHPVSLLAGHGAIHAAGTEMNFKLAGRQFSVGQQDTSLKGPHNLINTMCAVSAAVLAGVSEDSIRAGLKTFRNAPHRLESVAKIHGVEFVNDSKATNVDSVVYALGSYDQPLVWIAGGIDKGNDYGIIREAVASKVKSLICLGKDNVKLKEAFSGVVSRILETQDVRALVRMALEQAEAGDVVLLSPACASFDLFKNYEDRGDQFRAAVLELQQETGNN